MKIALIVAAVSMSCSRSASQPPEPTRWTHGFWFWSGSSTETRAQNVVDALYVHGGEIQRGQVYGGVATDLPAAREYWIVFRDEASVPPDDAVAKRLVEVAREQATELRLRGHKVAGVQLDIDCPTGSLRQYARFLREVRKHLPPGMQLSITALLDWFRPGTDVGDAIRAVDEFVPQFYDVGDPREGRVAAKIDGARWGPLFGRHQTRFRVGISTFGRARFVPRPVEGQGLYYGVRSVADLEPFDLAGRSAFHFDVATSPSGEKRLIYRPLAEQKVGYSTLQPGDAFEFTLATSESVRAAVEQARSMGPYCAGVLFFRWPAAGETMAMSPDEALESAGAVVAPVGSAPSLETVDGGCAAVACLDVYASRLPRLRPEGTRYRIASTEPLEYFLPAESATRQKVPARMADAMAIELRLPPYACQSRMLLGRAVTRKPTRLSIKEVP